MNKIFIALPIRRYIEPETLNTIYTKIYRESDIYEIGDFCQLRGSPNIYMQRYNLAKRFLAGDCTHYLYLDTDQTIISPDNALDVLIADDKDIISPLIVRRYFPHIPAVLSWKRKLLLAEGKNVDTLEDFRKYTQPFKVYYSCGGLCLIKRKVLEAVDKPFLPVFNEQDELMSTDYSFYSKAKKLGFECWAEPRIKVGHIGTYEYTMDDYYGLLDSGDVVVKKIDGKRYEYELVR